MYRPFVTCDDPKGVIECRPFRKSKNNPKRSEYKVENRRVSTNLNPSKEEGKKMVLKNATQDLQNPSSLQLMEVSKGAHKLNQMIDSWSKGMTFGGNSKEIAEDLLKGALDLQESLIMLGKLQEASQVLKKKQKERSSGERLDENRIERVKSDRFADHNYQKGFQKHRCSVDGSSRDCFEELRTAIRDGLARQNLLPPNSAEKMAYFDKRTLFSDPDIASTSSSQSSMVNFQSSASSDSSQSSKALQSSRGSNLIAKLMGLEEIPLESEKVFNQRRPVVDIDMPQLRKPQPFAYAVEKEPRKLTEIFEAMQHKGLLRSKFSEGLGFQSHHSDVYKSRRRNGEDAPPIVLIKPLSFSSVDEEEIPWQEFIQNAGALNTNEVLGKLKMKQLQPQTNCSERALNSDNMLRRFKREESPIRRSGIGVNNSQIQGKPEETVVKGLKVNEKLPSNKLKASVPVNQQQKKKIIEKKVDVIQKVTLRGKKPAEMENLKSKAVSKSRDQAKVISTKERKSAIRPVITKSRNPQQKSTSSSSIIMKPAMPAISHGHRDQKSNLNNAKPVKESLVSNLNVKNAAVSNLVNKLINFGPADESELLRTSTEAADQLLIEEGADASEIVIKEECDSSQNSLCNGTTQTQNTPKERYIKSSEEAEYLTSNHTSEKRCFGTKTIARDLFLRSPSFSRYAEELFHIDSNQAIILQTTTSLNDSEIASSRLLFDCATELMQHKSLSRHPLLLASVKSSKPSVSLAQLVDEVCNGIEILESYSRLGPDKLPGDSLYAILKSDLMCKGLSGGVWDWGWTHGFSTDEVEQIVGEIEKLLFKALIGDLFADFLI